MTVDLILGVRMILGTLKLKVASGAVCLWRLSNSVVP
jgi:hypothetical protein